MIMPFAIIVTDSSANPITVDVAVKYGHKATSIVTVNGVDGPPQDDDFTATLGSNAALKGGSATITTTVLKVSPSPKSEVDYNLTGSQSDRPDTSEIDFPEGVTNVTHSMQYKFI